MNKSRWWQNCRQWIFIIARNKKRRKICLAFVPAHIESNVHYVRLNLHTVQVFCFVYLSSSCVLGLCHLCSHICQDCPVLMTLASQMWVKSPYQKPKKTKTWHYTYWVNLYEVREKKHAWLIFIRDIAHVVRDFICTQYKSIIRMCIYVMRYVWLCMWELIDMQKRIIQSGFFYNYQNKQIFPHRHQPTY